MHSCFVLHTVMIGSGSRSATGYSVASTSARDTRHTTCALLPVRMAARNALSCSMPLLLTSIA